MTTFRLPPRKPAPVLPKPVPRLTPSPVPKRVSSHGRGAATAIVADVSTHIGYGLTFCGGANAESYLTELIRQATIALEDIPATLRKHGLSTESSKYA